MSMESSFDKIYAQPTEKGMLQYGVIRGTHTVFFIKTGLGGNIYGYKNKYLRLAMRLHQTYGYTVVVSDNLPGLSDPLADVISLVTLFLDTDDYQILFMGVSNGALIGAQYGWQYPEIRRMLLVNGPLMINWQRTKDGLQKFQGEKALMIYGDHDPSFRYCEIIHTIENPAVSYEIIPGADHNFAGIDRAFDSLPEKIIM